MNGYALAGRINMGYENIDHLALIVKTHVLPIVKVIRDSVNLCVRNRISGKIGHQL